VRGHQLPQYFFQHSIRSFQRVIVPKPNYAKPHRFETPCSFSIARSLLDMLAAIQLHYQFSFKADEINDVRRYRMLSPKLKSAEVAILQMQPQPQFGVG
jgi:hypothetical protein